MLKYELIPKAAWCMHGTHIHFGGLTGIDNHFICHADPVIHDWLADSVVKEAFGKTERREYTDSQHCIEHTLRF